MFSSDDKWRQAALLAILWTAMTSPNTRQADPASREAVAETARALFRRVMEEPCQDAPLPLLAGRVSSALWETPTPFLCLPPAPGEQVLQALVSKMGGMTSICALPNATEALFSFTAEPINVQSEVLVAARQGGNDSDSIFTAAQEAPALVAYADQQAALQKPVDVEHDYIGAYIRIHAANNYVRYRNGSLWVILDAVLQHRDPDWVRERVVDLVSTALTSGKLEYQENLPLTLMAWQAQAQQPGPASELGKALFDIQQQALKLEPQRGKNDTSGRITRCLAGMAEVQSCVFKDPNTASSLILMALNPAVFGFAGLYTPAALALAEAARVSLPGQPWMKDAALDKALQSVHRIQEAHFCVQSTARWNAMKKRWWDVSLSAGELENLVRAFAADSGDARFAALHHRGESYDQRPKNDPGQFPLPTDVLAASTLAQLADIYERPLAEFERLNPQDDGQQEWVNVPDPEFAPLLAARLAAEVLACPCFADPKRVELIQLLVPLAVSNPTALDSVLARLLLAMKPAGVETLHDLADAVAAYQKRDIFEA